MDGGGEGFANENYEKSFHYCFINMYVGLGFYYIVLISIIGV